MLHWALGLSIFLLIICAFIIIIQIIDSKAAISNFHDKQRQINDISNRMYGYVNDLTGRIQVLEELRTITPKEQKKIKRRRNRQIESHQEGVDDLTSQRVV